MASLDLQEWQDPAPMQQAEEAPLPNGVESRDSGYTSPSANDQNEDWVYPHPTDFKLTEAPIDEVRQLKVAVIGAGLTGTTASILLPAKVYGIKLTVFDKNADVVSLRQCCR